VYRPRLVQPDTAINDVPLQHQLGYTLGSKVSPCLNAQSRVLARVAIDAPDTTGPLRILNLPGLVTGPGG
jgi:hypothetical protein